MSVPSSGPNSYEPPASGLKVLLPQSVTVSRHRRGVVEATVAFDGEDTPSWLIRVLHGNINTILGSSELRNYREACPLELRLNLNLECITLGPCWSRIAENTTA